MWLTCGTCFAAHLTVNALSCIRVLHLPWNTETQHSKPECFSLKLQPTQKLCFTFTYFTGRRLADPILEFVVFPTFGTYVAVCAEFTIGYAGQASIVTPVRIESPGAVCPTATLVEETFLSIFIWGGGGGGGHRGLVNIKPTLFSPLMKLPLAIWNSRQETSFPKIWTLPKVKINELLIINTEVEPNGPDDYMGWRRDKRTCCQLCESSVPPANYRINTYCRNHNCLIERKDMSWGLTSESMAMIKKLKMHTFHYICIIEKNWK